MADLFLILLQRMNYKSLHLLITHFYLRNDGFLEPLSPLSHCVLKLYGVNQELNDQISIKNQAKNIHPNLTIILPSLETQLFGRPLKESCKPVSGRHLHLRQEPI